MYKIIDLDIKGDDRGSLIALEDNSNIPFKIKRVYYIFDTKRGVRRGLHAHRKLKQFIICVSGSCRILLDNGYREENIYLNTPTKGILLDSLIWREMYDFSRDCVLVVLASEYYDRDDYISDYQSFLKEVKAYG